MERGRKTKIIAILALVVAVVGMSLGFAAFSNILTISSSATVAPNEEDFKIVAYGIGEDVIYNDYAGQPESLPIDISLYNSSTSSRPFLFNFNDDNINPSASSAIIDNESSKITNLIIDFTEEYQVVDYIFVLKNEGKYDAYINYADYAKHFNGSPKTCVAEDGTTEELVKRSCENIDSYIHPLSPDDSSEFITNVTDSYKLAPGEHIRVGISFSVSELFADGNFTVFFEDIDIITTSAPKGEVVNP